MLALLKWDLSGYEEKHVFGCSNANIAYKSTVCLRRNFLVALEPMRKNKITLDRFGGGGCTVWPAGS